MNGEKVDPFRIRVDMHDKRTVLFVLLPNYIIVIKHCFMIYDACHLFLLFVHNRREEQRAIRRNLVKIFQI